MIDFSGIEGYYGPLQVEDLDAAVAMALNPDSAPDATHTSNLITSAAVAGVRSDIASINITGTTNDTGATIPQGTFFYASGVLVTAKIDIADAAPLTEGTNYEAVTAGGLNALIEQIMPFKRIGGWSSGSATISLPKGYGARLMVFSSANSNLNAFLITQSNGSGDVGVSTIFKGTGISFSTGNGTLIATLSSSGNTVAVNEMPLLYYKYSTLST